MAFRKRWLVIAGSLLALRSPADAVVLCQSPSGFLAVRDSCRQPETEVDPAVFALQRPCPPDSVKVGNVCIDKYEASVWQIPPSNTSLVQKVVAGNATLADLTGGGAAQLA